MTFSPDGKWLAFTEGNRLRKISVDGGQTTTLTELAHTVPQQGPIGTSRRFAGALADRYRGQLSQLPSSLSDRVS